jgi:hypothetical protein
MKHDTSIICRLPASMVDNITKICAEQNTTKSVLLRQGLENVIANWKSYKQEQSLIRQF